jgi:hypothetical protein
MHFIPNSESRHSEYPVAGLAVAPRGSLAAHLRGVYRALSPVRAGTFHIKGVAGGPDERGATSSWRHLSKRASLTVQALAHAPVARKIIRTRE